MDAKLKVKLQKQGRKTSLPGDEKRPKKALLAGLVAAQREAA